MNEKRRMRAISLDMEEEGSNDCCGVLNIGSSLFCSWTAAQQPKMHAKSKQRPNKILQESPRTRRCQRHHHGKEGALLKYDVSNKELSCAMNIWLTKT